MIMKKVICLLSLLACLFPVTGMAQGLHFGLKAGVLGNKADIHGMSSQIKEENQTGFQVYPLTSINSIRSSNGPGIVFRLLAVAMNSTLERS